MKALKTILICALAATGLAACTGNTGSEDISLRYKIVGSDVIVDASDFLDEIPRQHLIQSASGLGTDWLYNDFAIQFRTHANFTISNYFKDVTYPESGTYYMYVRSIGCQYEPYGARSRGAMARSGREMPEQSNGTFRIRVNDEYVPGSFGEILGASMTRVCSFDVKKGDVAHLMITRVTGSPALDCIVLSKNPDLTEEFLKQNELPEYMSLLHEYTLPAASGCVKFGDITGDGKTDYVVFGREYSSHAFNNAGELLWSWQAPEEYARQRSEFECPGLLWDFDRDGKCELVQWREDEEGEWLVMCNAQTGEILNRTPWPAAAHPHVYNNYRLAVANTDGVYPASVLLYSDCGAFQTYGIYDSSLKEVWRHEIKTKKDHLGHYFYAHDLDGDGIDEIIGGWRVVDSKGNIIWSRLEDIYDNHDHVDTYRFADMDGDGKDEVIIGACDLGAQVRNGMTGELMSIAAAEHTQQLEVGRFLDGQKLPQIAAGARIYRNRTEDPYLLSQLYWIDSKGNLISRWPMNGLNGNPDITKGDFYGNGSEVCFWNKFLMQPDGRGKLAVKGDVYHCFDFEHNGHDQVITLADGKLRVYGWKHAKKGRYNDNPDHLKEKMANHTHY